MLRKSPTSYILHPTVRIHTLQRTSRKEGCPESLYSFRLIPKASSKGDSEVQLGPIKAARKEKQLAETTAQSRWSHIPGLKFMPPSRSWRVLRSDVLTDLIIYRGTICKTSDLAPSIFQVQVWDFDLNLCLTHSISARAQWKCGARYQASFW